MSEQNSYLLFDVGNSRIKYATYADGVMSEVELITADTDLLALIRDRKAVLISAVKQNDILRNIVKAAEDLGVEVQQIKTEPETLGLTCAYEIYPKLGVDRWLSMLALQPICNKPFAVIDLGTASTCDFVCNNKHLGGWIAPGFDLMRCSLVSNTFQVTADDNYPKSLTLGDSTESCVNNGCLAYIQGMVSAAQSQLAKIDSDYMIFIDGGSYELLRDVLGERVTITRDLVFKGLIRFI